MARTFNLADLFEQVAVAAPDRTAVVAGADRRTYGELDERCNRFTTSSRSAWGAGITSRSMR
jgi:non-ribosomal peptide synthetase component F